MKREKLWIIGVLTMIVGSFLAVLPILGSRGLHFVWNLRPYFGGFFIVGLGVIDFGVLFALIVLYASKKEQERKE